MTTHTPHWARTGPRLAPRRDHSYRIGEIRICMVISRHYTDPKPRPCVLLYEETKWAQPGWRVAKITTQPASLDAPRIPIPHWAKLGLTSPSYLVTPTPTWVPTDCTAGNLISYADRRLVDLIGAHMIIEADKVSVLRGRMAA